MALKVARFRDVTKNLAGKLTEGLLIPRASLWCATPKAHQVCSLIGTKPRVIKLLKGAVFIRVKKCPRVEAILQLSQWVRNTLPLYVQKFYCKYKKYWNVLRGPLKNRIAKKMSTIYFYL